MYKCRFKSRKAFEEIPQDIWPSIEGVALRSRYGWCMFEDDLKNERKVFTVKRIGIGPDGFPYVDLLDYPDRSRFDPSCFSAIWKASSIVNMYNPIDRRNG